jgi:ATP-dependent DNA ligase
VFDALAVAGADVRAAPWSERRARLEELLGTADGAVRLTPVLEVNPALHAALVATAGRARSPSAPVAAIAAGTAARPG